MHLKKSAFECEAKRVWVNLARKPDVLAGRVAEEMASALREVKRLQSGKGLALCFAVRAISRSKIGVLHERLRAWINRVKIDCSPDALAWIGFPEGHKPPMLNGFVHPGLLLLIREKK